MWHLAMVHQRQLERWVRQGDGYGLEWDHQWLQGDEAGGGWGSNKRFGESLRGEEIT